MPRRRRNVAGWAAVTIELWRKAVALKAHIMGHLAHLSAIVALATVAHPALAQQDPLPRGDFTFTITPQDPTTGDGRCDTPSLSDPACAQILVDVTVGTVTYTTLTLPNSFQASGFPVGSNVQSRIHNVIGTYRFGDLNYDADMLANVFSNRDLNSYQQVDSSATAGSFIVGYPNLIPATADNFFLITERLGNNRQYVEALDDSGNVLGEVVVDSGAPDYTQSGARVHPSQDAFIALIPLDRFAGSSGTTPLIRSFRITNRDANDGGDFKAFVIGAGIGPLAVDDEDLDNTPGPVTVDVLNNDSSTANIINSSVEIVTPSGNVQSLNVPGQGDWSVNTTTGEITFTPLANFGGDPTPISYTVRDDSPGLSNEATVTITYLINPSLTLEKTVTNVLDTNLSGTLGDAGDTVSYGFEVTNTGNVSLDQVRITDALLGIMDLPTSPAALAPTETATLTATYVIQDRDVTAGEVSNTATAEGRPVATTAGNAADAGNPLLDATGAQLAEVSDVSDTGSTPPINGGTPATVPNPGTTDSDGTPGNDGDEPTVLVRPSVAALELVKSITNVADTNTSGTVGDETDTITYSFTVTNTGNTALGPITLVDTMLGLNTSVAPAGLLPGASVTLPGQTYQINALDVAALRVDNTATATATPVATVAGVPDIGTPLTGLAAVNDTSDTGTEPLNAGSTPVTIANPAADGGSDPTTLFLPSSGTTFAPAPPGIELTKTTPEDIIQRGQIVPYTIQLQNGTGTAFGPVDIIDTLPPGFVYIPGTAELDGVPVVPTVTDTTVTISGVASPAGSTRIVTLSLRALTGTGPGNYVNTAIALDPILDLTAGPATATVRILPEAVFDCATVIGRVFDDLDGDGYQDSFEPGVNPVAISNQDYIAGAKYDDETPLDPLDEERGLPGVRLVALDGTVITTDANGLFSVPCSALPADRGSNFLLSLDERTLPVGFEMTTENPRVMRLTPGMITEMNFGAQLAGLVRVDLSGAAFGPGGSLTDGLRGGVAALVTYLQDNPASVGLIYHVPADANADTVAAARAAMERVDAEIRRQWAEVSRRRLDIRQTIAREGQ